MTVPYTFATASGSLPLSQLDSNFTALGQASNIANTPAGTIASTDVQSAINEIVSDSAASSGSSLVGYLPSGTGAVAATVQGKLRESVSVFDFMTTAQIASVQAYNYAVDVTAAMQAAINQTEASGQTLLVPPGGYLLSSTLTVPTNSTTKKYRVIKITGAGVANPFAIGSAGTVFKNLSAQTILSYAGSGASPVAEDEFDISGIVFWSASSSNTLPVVYLAGFYGVGQFHHNVVYQTGTGNGMEVSYAAGVSIYANYFMNRDVVTSGLGASRVGIGLYIPQNYDAGLLEIRKNSSRGWLTAYQLGQVSAGGVLYKALMDANECSTTYNGIIITNKCQGTTISNGYLEGGDGGVAFTDNGLFTTISGNFSFAGYSVHISSGADTYGGIYVGNTMSVSTPGGTAAIGIRLNCTGAYSGLNRTCTGNTIVFGGSGGTIAGVVGMELSGVSPKLNINSNTFNPPNWSGGAGTTKINDLSTISTGSGSGVYGFGVALDGSAEFPYLGQGSYGVGLSGTTLTQSNVVANVLTVTAASDFIMTATVATTVNSITATNIENKLLWIRTTNANTTFANTANLKMVGGLDYTPGASGASICFKCHNGVCYEVARSDYTVSYAPIESTWTPTLTSSSGTITSYTATGKYTRIGRQVTLTLNATITDNGTGAGALIFASFPYTITTNVACYGRNQSTGITLGGLGQNLQWFISKYDNTYPVVTGNVIIATLIYLI